jgi:hypothetical protein
MQKDAIIARLSPEKLKEYGIKYAVVYKPLEPLDTPTIHFETHIVYEPIIVTNKISRPILFNTFPIFKPHSMNESLVYLSNKRLVIHSWNEV